MALLCIAVAVELSFATTGTRHGSPADVHQCSQPSRQFRPLPHACQSMRAARQRRADVTMISHDSLAAVGGFDDNRDMAQRGGNLAIPDEPAVLDDTVNAAADAACRGAADAARAAADAAKAAVDAAKAAADATPTVVDAAPAAAGAAPAAADATTATALAAAQITANAQKEVAQIAADGAAHVAEIAAGAQKEVAQIAADGAAHVAEIAAGAQKEVAQIAADGAEKAAHLAHTSGDALTLSSTIMAEALIVGAMVGFVGMAVSKVNNDDPIWTKVKQLTPPRWSEANDAKSLYTTSPTSWPKPQQAFTPAIVDEGRYPVAGISQVYTPPSVNENVNECGSDSPERLSTSQD